MATFPSIRTVARVAVAAALALGLGGCPTHRPRRPPAPPNSNIDLDPIAVPARPQPAPPPQPVIEETPPPQPPPPPPPPVQRAAPPPPIQTGCGNGAGERFFVQGVAANDTLNVRADPDPRSAVLGQLQPDSTGVIGTEETARVGSAVWRKIKCQQLVGWVNERFLGPEGQQAAAPAPAPEPEPQPDPEPVKKKGTDPKLW